MLRPQANTSPPKLNREEVKGRGALLSDICKDTKLRKVSVVNDRSAPLLDSKIQTPKSQTPSTEHPYIRLYQYLHQQPSQQGAACEEQKKMAGEERSALSLESKTTNLLWYWGCLQEAEGQRSHRRQQTHCWLNNPGPHKHLQSSGQCLLSHSLMHLKTELKEVSEFIVL